MRIFKKKKSLDTFFWLEDSRPIIRQFLFISLFLGSCQFDKKNQERPLHRRSPYIAMKNSSPHHLLCIPSLKFLHDREMTNVWGWKRRAKILNLKFLQLRCAAKEFQTHTPFLIDHPTTGASIQFFSCNDLLRDFCMLRRFWAFPFDRESEWLAIFHEFISKTSKIMPRKIVSINFYRKKTFSRDNYPEK